MAYRIPTHLESFAPPPGEQITHTNSPGGHSRANVPGSPWRGSLIVSGLRPSDRSSNVDIRAFAVEIDGDCTPKPSKTHLWPPSLFFSIRTPRGRSTPPTGISMAHAQTEASRARSESASSVPLIKLSDMQAWMNAARPEAVPVVTFFADKINDPSAHAANQENFRNLNSILWEGQMVAYIPWNTSSPSDPSRVIQRTPKDGGILLYPNNHRSSTTLTGAVYLYGHLPPFVQAALGVPVSSGGGLSLSIPESTRASLYQQPLSAPLHGHSPTISRSLHAHSPGPSSLSGGPYSPFHQQQRHSVSPISSGDLPSPTSSITPISGQRQYIRRSEDLYRSAPTMSIQQLPPISGRSPYSSSSTQFPPMTGSSSSPSYPTWSTARGSDEEQPYYGASSSSSSSHQPPAGNGSGNGHAQGSYGQ